MSLDYENINNPQLSRLLKCKCKQNDLRCYGKYVKKTRKFILHPLHEWDNGEQDDFSQVLDSHTHTHTFNCYFKVTSR